MDLKTDAKATDRSALLMMLAYVEAECLRLGADAAARHAAMAAALVPGGEGESSLSPGAALH
ncbi:hypothetical protein [Falsiroseomonas oryzae]|uniref:hypothetical protein n=1 Tax=Falsiroseomonas oryzae TaxID=2766473 RepID=UPI0022EA4D74|nr:hypothetical protein [Roseomonas sp. MO-31]